MRPSRVKALYRTTATYAREVTSVQSEVAQHSKDSPELT